MTLSIDLFTELGGHKDSKTKIRECEYQMAISMMENGHYEEAISIFQNLTGYKDSLDKINECKINMETGEIDTLYSRAVELMNNGMYEEALTSFEAISAAKDCSREIVQCRKMQILSYKVVMVSQCISAKISSMCYLQLSFFIKKFRKEF